MLDSKEREKMLIDAKTEKQQGVQKKRVKARNDVAPVTRMQTGTAA